MATQPKKQTRCKVQLPAQALALGSGWGYVDGSVGGVLFWWQGQQAAGSFEAFTAQGKPGLEARVVTNPDAGRGHSNIGVPIVYATDPPTSGVHWPNWT